MEFEPRERPKNNIYAVEGVNGSGKSHTLNLLRDLLINDGDEVEISKIAGLGDSSRVNELKQILYGREEMRRSGSQTTKQADDHRQQTLFRLATKYQIRNFTEKLAFSNNNSVHLLDRTPLMTLAYCFAEDPQNPYLDEIMDEALRLTDNLGIRKAFLLDINPTLSIARTIARSVVDRPDFYSEIEGILQIMGIPGEMKDEIIEKVNEVIQNNPNLMPKPFSLWDYNDFRVTINESYGYLKAFDIAHREVGLNYEVITTDKPVEEVAQSIKTIINDLKRT